MPTGTSGPGTGTRMWSGIRTRDGNEHRDRDWDQDEDRHRDVAVSHSLPGMGSPGWAAGPGSCRREEEEVGNR
ncbi:hypothetical protein TURU_077447 [Turdus rufiventris]|nr:hypothetical protein TURU_077447 [Turdus rufiventris]